MFRSKVDECAPHGESVNFGIVCNGTLREDKPPSAVPGSYLTQSDTMDLSISFRKSKSPQKRRFDISIGDSKQQIDDFVGELTLPN
jgi:hypothetical protein